MRVIWISLGILAVFIVALFAVYEPQQDQAVDALAKAPVVVDNPFVEEKSENNMVKEVDLAVLPSGEVISSTDQVTLSGTPSGTPNNQSTSSTTIAPLNQSSEQAAAPQVTKVQVTEEFTTTLESSDSVGEKESAKEEKNGKKPGLAMLAFEKEKKKNKVAVIVNEANLQKLSVKEIKALYLDRLTRWQDGSRVMLFDLPLGDKYRDKFSKSILKMTALEADKQESKRRELRIKANDVEVKSKNVVVSYVEQNPNAVAYVPLNLVREKAGVKIVLTIP